MDEMRMIGDMLDEPPTEQAADTGRRRLREEIAGPSGAGRRNQAKARRGLPRFPLFSGLGLLAAGAAAAVAISATGSGAPPTGGTDQPVQIDLGKQTILAAAEKVAMQKTGKYWFSNEIHGLFYVVRAETGSYAVVGSHDESFVWSGARKGMGQEMWFRDLPAGPLTPEDVAAWKKAGSPSTFRVWSNDHYRTLERSKSKWVMDNMDPHETGGVWLDGETGEDLRNLPTDPKRLAELFIEPVRDPVTEHIQRLKKHGVKDAEERFAEWGACGTPAERASRARVIEVGKLLMGTPIPPAVRAGLMRALIDRPGIEAIGGTVDVLGRKGVALASRNYPTCRDGDFDRPTEEQGRYRSRQVLVFDKETGEVLARQEVLTEPGGKYKDREPGFVISFNAVRDAGWTDTEPTPPEELPS